MGQTEDTSIATLQPGKFLEIGGGGVGALEFEEGQELSEDVMP